MFQCALITCMQFGKTSKKTRKTAEETTAVPESTSQVEISKPRTTRSSKSKSSELSETGSVMHRKATSKKPVPAAKPEPVIDTPAVAASVAAPILEEKAMVAAASASSTDHQVHAVAQRTVSREEIAQLAHSYWVARNYAWGSPEEDWLRAERELQTRS